MAATPGVEKDARLKGLYRTVPDTRIEVSVSSGSNGTQDLTALKGKYVFLQARGGDVTVKRGASAITEAGDGIKILDGTREEFFVDGGESLVLNHWGSAACSLDILYDSAG